MTIYRMPPRLNLISKVAIRLTASIRRRGNRLDREASGLRKSNAGAKSMTPADVRGGVESSSS